MAHPGRSPSRSLPDRLLAALGRLAPGTEPLLVAVSGGLDSMVLLELLLQTREQHGRPLLVAHLDHGIHPESAAPRDLVRRRAAAAGVECIVGSAGLGPGAGETGARVARLRWLRETASARGARWIVTAHQRDDQLETVLMRLLRGSGPAGLAGMSPVGRGMLRPLLGVSRATLQRYAIRQGLTWWEDPANRESRHLRSWIRTTLVPLLEQRLPDLKRRLAGASRQARLDRTAWRAALREWPGLGWSRETGRPSLAWQTLLALPSSLAAQLVAALVREVGGPGGVRRIGRALTALRSAPSGARADLGGGWRLERAFHRLLLLAPEGPDVEPRRSVTAVSIDGPAGETRWGPWRVRWATERAPPRQARDGSTAWFIPGELALRHWRPGDRLAPLGGRGQRLAVRVFQDARVPRSERADWPLLCGAGRLAWIPGVCRSGLLLPEPGAPALRIDVDVAR